MKVAAILLASLLPLPLAANGRDALATANNQFAFDLYRRIAAKPGNVFFSPYSISTALTLTQTGARGATAAEMAKTLHLTASGNALAADEAALIRAINLHDASFALVTANSLWVDKSAALVPEFVTNARTSFASEVAPVDFAHDSDAARRRINSWVETKTQQMIRDLLPPGTPKPNSRLVIANAIYFKAKWVAPFEHNATRDAAFHTDASHDVQLPAMHRRGSYAYAHTGGVRIIEMPYEGSAVSFYAILPDAVDGLGAVEQSLDAAKLDAWIRALAPREVVVSIPRFSVTKRAELSDLLTAMGMPLAFDTTGKADFSGMIRGEKVNISNVIHQAKIDFDEKGTEAAAATAVVIERTMARVEPIAPEVFNADHPFVYVIRHKATNTILFVGRFAGK